MDTSESLLMRIRETLHDDLLDYFDDDSRKVDHPLIPSVTVFGAEHAAELNEQYEQKAILAEQALRDGDWSAYLKFHERPHRLNAFVYVIGDLDDRCYWECLAETWIDAEFPWQNRTRWSELWNSKRSKKEFAMSPEERDVLKGLPQEFTLYRGVGQNGNSTGLSWTLSREKAVFFAQRFRGDQLLTATAKRDDVHSYLNGRNEQEIVIESTAVQSRETIVKRVETGGQTIASFLSGST
jgi:hypothetical protein